MDEYDKAINRLIFMGSVELSLQPQNFNVELFLGAHDILTLGKLFDALGFSEKFLVLNTGSIYTENSDLIKFCQNYNIPIKVYHNFSFQMVEL